VALALPPQVWRDAIHIGALAGPLIMTQLAQVALTTIDLVMMGLLGPVDIAAGGLALVLFNLLRATGAGMLTATGNLVAHALGQGDFAQVRHLLRASLALGTLAAMGAALLLCAAERPLVWLGQDPALARRAGQFMAVLAPGLLPCFWFQSLRQFTIGMRQPGPLLAITIFCTALNGALDYLLIFGHWGFPRLGLVGIAWATSGVNLLSFLLFLGVLGRRRDLSRHVSLTFYGTGMADWKADLTALSLAAKVLTIDAILQFFDCAQNIGVGVMRGIGEVRRSFHVTLLGYWVIGLPIAYLLGIALHSGLFGVWIGLAIGLASTAALLWRTFDRQLAMVTAENEPNRSHDPPATIFRNSRYPSLFTFRTSTGHIPDMDPSPQPDKETGHSGVA
jgi:Na+-driven multidrug efflux pump